MRLETFFKKFEQFAETPNAVAKMREFVLQLAVQGKLVDQDINEGHAESLLKQIKCEKARLVKERLIKKQDTDPIGKDEELFSIPGFWVWTRLGEIGDWGAGSTPSRGNYELFDGGITWLKSGELNDNQALAGSEETVTELAIKTCSFRMNRPGDVLLAMYGATIGKVAILSEPAVTNQAVCGCTPFVGVSNRYLFNFLLSQRAQFHSASEGGAQPNISKVKIVGFPFPLPPLAEQKRIVAKVDELMALCDRLDAHQQERDTRHAALARAALARFADAPTPANLNLLFHPAYAIEPADIRKAILTLAVQGKLVPQDVMEGSASLEFEVIQRRKESLVRDSQIKKAELGKWVDPDEVDYEIPESWIWVRLADICELITDGTHLTPKYTESGRMFLSAQNVKPFKFMPDKHRFVSEEHYQGYIKNRKPEKGDVLLTRVGAGIGEAATINQNLDFAIYVSLGLVRPVRGFIFSDYITLWLNSPDGTSKSSRNTYGKGVSQGNLNLSLIRDFLVPLPPLAEQRRIVAKVDQLMTLVDQLEAQLADSRTAATNLMEAVVAELTVVDKPS